METVTTLIQPFSAPIDAKLGRCARCMRLSAGLTAGSLLLLAALMGAGAGTPLVFAAVVLVGAFTTLSIAHGIAYLVRGPAPVKGCVSCAEKAKARQRAARRQRRWSWLLKPKAAAASRTSSGCRTCSKPRSLEALYAMADELPRADEGLRAVVESSPEYQSLLPRLAALEPIDSWQVDLRNHFVYRLKPETDGEGATALFVARWEDYTPLVAVVVIPDPNGGEPRIVDLRAEIGVRPSIHQERPCRSGGPRGRRPHCSPDASVALASA
jgi:hypothetical protein